MIFITVKKTAVKTLTFWGFKIPKKKIIIFTRHNIKRQFSP